MTGERSEPRRLVFVDDDADLVELVSLALEDTTWSVPAFADPAAALEHLETSLPDVLVVDVRMPKMNGDQLLDQLADAGKLDGVRVLVSSSVQPPPTIWRPFERHRARFVPKDDLFEASRLLPYLD